jgi:hypothetical protein
MSIWNLSWPDALVIVVAIIAALVVARILLAAMLGGWE